MITTDRNITLTCHVTKEVKEAFRSEAIRRQMGMSELLFNILTKWIVTAPNEPIDQKRSNKRMVDTTLQFDKNAFSNVMTHLKSEICDNYTRPQGMMGGPCLNCGASHTEHIEKALSKEVDIPLPLDKS